MHSLTALGCYLQNKGKEIEWIHKMPSVKAALLVTHIQVETRRPGTAFHSAVTLELQ